MTDSFKLKSLVLGVSLAVMAGCSTTDTQTDDPMTGDAADQQARQAGEAYGAGADGEFTDEELTAEQRAAREARDSAEQALREVTTVYFDFDSSEIKRESRDVLTAHARYLAANRNASVVLEGHTDERGTQEYNLALGERRAESVQRFLMVNDVNSGQIETVSYGEERPAVDESNERAWAQNRRVEIIYQ